MPSWLRKAAAPCLALLISLSANAAGLIIASRLAIAVSLGTFALFSQRLCQYHAIVVACGLAAFVIHSTAARWLLKLTRRGRSGLGKGPWWSALNLCDWLVIREILSFASVTHARPGAR